MAELRKLSELIREGAQLRPQTFDAYFDNVNCGDEMCLGSCALGAAYEAITGRSEMHVSIFDAVAAATGIDLVKTVIEVPVSDYGRAVLCNAITVLNDDYLWTRENIADWLAENGY